MRSLKRNETQIYYAVYVEDSITDEWGNTSGGYGDPELYSISLSANKGEASAQVFGADLKYDREMVTHDMSCPINEYSRLWIGVDTDNPHNYVVKAVASSLNSIRYAIERVNVREANN